MHKARNLLWVVLALLLLTSCGAKQAAAENQTNTTAPASTQASGSNTTSGEDAAPQSDTTDTAAQDTTEIKGADAPPKGVPSEVFKSVTASETLTDSSGSSYTATNAIDGDPQYDWRGTGVGSWLKLEGNQTCRVSGFYIIAGRGEDQQSYISSSRIKDVEVLFSDGSTQTFTLDDNALRGQIVALKEPVDTMSMQFTIKSVYSGSVSQDVAIAEVIPY